MRVWCLVSTFPVLTTTFLVNRILGLVRSGHAVRIIAVEPGHDGQEAIDDLQRSLMPLVRMPPPHVAPGRILRRLLQDPLALARACDPLRFRSHAGPRLAELAELLRREPPPDAVLACFGPMGELACCLAALGAFDAPIVASFHGVDAYGRSPLRLRRRYRLLRRRGDLILPVSEHMRRHLVRIGFRPGRLRVLHTPVLLDQLQWRGPRPCASPLRILGLGRLVAKKGFADGLRTIAVLRDRGVPAIFRIIGDGPERARLEAQRSALGLADRVVFEGWQPHQRVFEALREADLLLSTNRTAANGDQEGIPNTIKEALAIGVPVVATRHSGTPEVILDRRTGLLADEGDAAGLAAACQALAEDPALAAACAEAGRRLLQAGFSDRLLAADLDRHLHAVVVARGRSVRGGRGP